MWQEKAELIQRYSGDWLAFSALTIQILRTYFTEGKMDQIHVELQGASNRQNILEKIKSEVS